MMRRRLAVLFSLSVCLTLGSAGLALAHVTVSPEEVSPGSSGEYTVSVPNELDAPTVEVRVEVPEGFQVDEVDEAPGWSVEEEEEGGRVAAISWSGGEIPVEGSEEFVFGATAPEEAGEFAFRATQTYSDGTVVEWTGPEDSGEPASVVSVTGGETSGDSGHDGHSHGDDHGSVTEAPLPDSGGAGYATLAGGLALMLLGASALRVSALRGRS